jgi:hypothetical protein
LAVVLSAIAMKGHSPALISSARQNRVARYISTLFSANVQSTVASMRPGSSSSSASGRRRFGPMPE